MICFIFSSQQAASTSRFCSFFLYLSPPAPFLLSLALLVQTFRLSDFPFISRLISLLPAAFVCCSLVAAMYLGGVLPEGTVAGLKGANSSAGGCRPCEGSRVLAGEAGVCAGRNWEMKSGHVGI